MVYYGYLSLRCLSQKSREKNKKKEPKSGRKKSRIKLKSRYKNIGCHIIVIKHDTFINIVLSGKGETKKIRTSRKRMIMVMIVSLLLEMAILFFLLCGFESINLVSNEII